MTAGQVAQPTPDAGTLAARVRALERQLHQAGHEVRLLPVEPSAALCARLQCAFVETGALELVEVLYELVAPRMVEALRATIVAENLAFDPVGLLPELLARTVRASSGLGEVETFDETLDQLAKSVVLDAQKAASRSLVREQRAVEIEFGEHVPPPAAKIDPVALDRGFAALQEGYRRCLVLRDREGLAYYDIGDQGGLDANVATRVRRARERLHQLATFLSHDHPPLAARLSHGRRELDTVR